MIITDKELLKQDPPSWTAPFAGQVSRWGFPSPTSPARRHTHALVLGLTALALWTQLNQLFPWPNWPHKVSATATMPRVRSPAVDTRFGAVDHAKERCVSARLTRLAPVSLAALPRPAPPAACVPKLFTHRRNELVQLPRLAKHSVVSPYSSVSPDPPALSRFCHSPLAPPSPRPYCALPANPSPAAVGSAFFTVPWDHLNMSNPLNFSLAIRKFPATVPAHSRLGTLFVNPGGPGASGTEEIARIGPDMSSIVGGFYDLVSWDPRGVNLTSPRLDCFPTEAVSHNWQRDQERVGLRYENAPMGHDAPGEHATGGELAWAARIAAFAESADQACSRNGRREVLEGSGTAATARDLRMMAKAMGETKGVNYWGFSYGTVLGATFAVSKGPRRRIPLTRAKYILGDCRPCSRTRCAGSCSTGS